ncbi:MAG: phosphate ABC transporter permease PstA [Hyphomicrobiaceae bacterium]
MTDLATISTTAVDTRVSPHRSQYAASRLKRRYGADLRFRAYGLVALGVTAVFLALLLVNIVTAGWPALWQHSLQLEVDAKADLLGLGAKREVADIKGADYFPVVRAALKTAIPGIESRSGERTLTRLVSNGAPDVIRAKLVADPKAIDTKFKVPLLLSSTADLYYKGAGTPITSRPGRGIITPIAADGGLKLLSASNDFADDLVRIKKTLAERATQLSNEADRLARIGGPQVTDKVKELRDEAAAARARFEKPTVAEDLDSKMPTLLVAMNGGLVKLTKINDADVSGEILLPLTSLSEAKPGDWQLVTYATPESNRKVTDQEVAFLERMRTLGVVEKGLSWRFFSSGDSREPELAGILGALTGTALTLFITLALCLPIGVLSAVYLEEFAPKNKFTDLVEVNINNLAAVPSIVFGLLGLAMFINFFGLPRSVPLVGGLVLALLVLPTIIIASRAALKAVPPSIKEAALGVGASHQQAVFHHVLPLAMPGIMTGTIIGMAHALGETAPLLMIGMVAFIVDIPSTFQEAATVLPVQIYLWSDLPEEGFKAKTAAAIMVLLVFLFVMNGAAIWLRKKFERRW